MKQAFEVAEKLIAEEKAMLECLERHFSALPTKGNLYYMFDKEKQCVVAFYHDVLIARLNYELQGNMPGKVHLRYTLQCVLNWALTIQTEDSEYAKTCFAYKILKSTDYLISTGRVRVH